MTEEQEQKTSRRERRAQAAGGAADEVKDRNKKIRAEAAARRRKDRERELAAAQSEGLDAQEAAGDALARSADATGRFVRQHFKWLQWVVIAGLAGGMAFLVWNYRKELDREAQGHAVNSALDTSHGRIADPDAQPPQGRYALVDVRPEFGSEEEKLAQTLEQWGKVSGQGSPELALLGRLGKASVLYDQQNYAEARTSYDGALASGAIGRFPQLRARALEGVGLCLEAEGKLDDASKAFQTFRDLGDEHALHARFHLARVDYSRGKKDEAKAALKELITKLKEKEKSSVSSPGYLLAAAEDLLKTLDPSAIEAPAGMTPEQIQELMQRMQASQPPMPSGPVEQAPEAPAEELPAPASTTGSADSTPAPSSAPTTPAPKAPAAPAPAPTSAPKAPAAPATPAPPAPAPAAPAPAAPEGGE